MYTTTYGAWGPEAVSDYYTPKLEVVVELYGHLSLLLVKDNTRSILFPNTPTR